MNFDMKELMKKAGEMQSAMARKQEELSKRSFEASSGGGMVTVQMNGRQELTGIKIDPAIVASNDVEMLQDLIIAAVNEASKRVGEALKQEMSGMLGGLTARDL